MWDDTEEQELYDKPWRCYCGKFVMEVIAVIRFVFDEPECVLAVTGVCKQHGRIPVMNPWDFELIEARFGPFEKQGTGMQAFK